MSTGPDIRDRIVARRRERIASEGHGFGHAVPERRELPLVPFGNEPFAICEIKKRSPSRGDLNIGMDVVAQARLYWEAGVRSVSVLTEEDHFKGSLEDLMAVKRALPGLSVLRKDFLVDTSDIDIAYRAGADAILLIASMLSASELKQMYDHAKSLGLAVLVEIHDEVEVPALKAFSPDLVGINCRNLQTFALDRLKALVLSEKITWPSRLVFESGIFTAEDVRQVKRYGFSGVLVGEALVRNPESVGPICRALVAPSKLASGTKPAPEPGFWSRVHKALEARVGEKRNQDSGAGHEWSQSLDKEKSQSESSRAYPQAQGLIYTRPLVKICGLGRVQDAELAAELGADLLGFVFAPSKRRASPELLEQLKHLSLPKVAVVVGTLDFDLLYRLLDQRLIDAVQFSGTETLVELEALLDKLEQALGWRPDWYKAVHLGSEADLAELEQWRTPRVLVDAKVEGSFGGTGTSIPVELVRSASAIAPLWLAGGLRPESVASILAECPAELVDVASGVESEPGKKDPAKLRSFFLALEKGA